MNDIEELKSRINIVDIVSEKIRLKKSGVNYFGLCPFHGEKSPSFSVNEQIQIFKCFGCGISGDVIKFLEKSDNLTFPEALEVLSERTGYKLNSVKIDDRFLIKKNKLLNLNKLALNFFKKNYYEDTLGKQYLEKRGINDVLVDEFGIGYASQSNQKLYTYLKQFVQDDSEMVESGLFVKKENKKEVFDKFKDRVIFSVFDIKGNIIGFSGRFIGNPKPGFEPPKYLNSPETLVFQKSKNLYGIYQAQEHIKKLKFVILSEGQMNIISSSRIGVKNIVASLGTSFTVDHVKLLRRFTNNIYLAFDKDTAGKNALIRTIKLVNSLKLDINLKIINWDSKIGKDPDELIMTSSHLWIDSVNNPLDPIDFFIKEFKEKYPNPNIDIKKRFLNIIKEIIYSYDDNWVQKEYFKVLAIELGILIDEEFNQINKEKNTTLSKEKNNIFFANFNNPNHTFFALILQNWSELKYEIEKIDRDIFEEKYLDFFDCLLINIDTDDLNDIKNNLDDELRIFFDDFLLKKIIFDKNLNNKDHLESIILNIIRSRYNSMVEIFKQDVSNNKILLLKNKLAMMLINLAKK